MNAPSGQPAISSGQAGATGPTGPTGPAPVPRLRTTVVLGLFANAGLSAIKLAAGILGHSYALIADAVESLLDVVASVVTLQGVRLADRPPDGRHPWGYGKAEALAALVVSGMIVLAGVGIGVQAVREIFSPHRAPAAWTLWVLLAVVVVKEAFYRIASATAQRASSTAVLADAWHHRSDAITSVLAGVGISIAVFGGEAWWPAEDYAALAASLIILINGSLLMRAPLGELLDRDCPDLAGDVRTVALSVPGVVDVEKVHARKSGRRHLVDMHLHVDPAMPISAAHAVGGKVRATVRQRLPQVADVLVHLEPASAAVPPPSPAPAPASNAANGVAMASNASRPT
ncbi:MAG: cation diffusion facilitator family transporter [bacterium]